MTSRASNAVAIDAPTDRKDNALHIQEFVAVSRFRHHADLRLSEDAIAIVGNEIVDAIPHPAWRHSANASNAPNAAKFLQEKKDRVGPREQVLVNCAVLPHYIHRIEIRRVRAVALQETFRKLALQ